MISQMDNMNYKGRHPRIRIMLDIDKRNRVCLAVCVCANGFAGWPTTVRQCCWGTWPSAELQTGTPL